jgi:hypothetical protein
VLYWSIQLRTYVDMLPCFAGRKAVERVKLTHVIGFEQ